MVQIISYQREPQNFIKRASSNSAESLLSKKVYCRVSWYALRVTVHNLSCFPPRILLTAIYKTLSNILTSQVITCNWHQFYITIQEISKTERIKLFLTIISYNQFGLTFWFLAYNYSLKPFSIPITLKCDMLYFLSNKLLNTSNNRIVV